VAWSEVECHCRCPLTAALMLRPFVLCAMGAGTVLYCTVTVTDGGMEGVRGLRKELR